MAAHATRKQGTAARQQTIARNAARQLKRSTTLNATRAGHVRNLSNRAR